MCACVCMCVLVPQSCPILCDPMDSSPPGSSVHGILQARILQWVAIPFSRGSSWPRNQTGVSYIAGRFFTNWATREDHRKSYKCYFWLIPKRKKKSTMYNFHPYFIDKKIKFRDQITWPRSHSQHMPVPLHLSNPKLSSCHDVKPTSQLTNIPAGLPLCAAMLQRTTKETGDSTLALQTVNIQETLWRLRCPIHERQCVLQRGKNTRLWEGRWLTLDCTTY